MSLKYCFHIALLSSSPCCDGCALICVQLSLGQFYHGLEFEVSEPFPGKDANKPDAMMFVKGQELVVTR